MVKIIKSRDKSKFDLETGKQFKGFNDTFSKCAFALAIGLLYPNKNNIRKKWYLFILVLTVNFAELFWFVAYLLKCIKNVDIYNVTRNVSIGIIVTLFFFKSFYVNWKHVEFGELLNKITKDLLQGNELDEDYQVVYQQFIGEVKIAQTIWIIIPLLLTSQFPLYATVGMIYETLKSDVGKKIMQHEMELKFLEDKQYDTPYYEIIYAYNFLQCIVLMPSFTGFDGSFCISTTHLRLKLKLIVLKLQKAFNKANSAIELRKYVKEVIKDHQDAMDFYSKIQEVYGGWLFVVFLMTSGMISFNIYQIYLIGGIDPKYTIFAISGVCHMYMPCSYASRMIVAGEKTVNDIYAAPWEVWADPVVTKDLTFVIAKAQQELLLTGKGMVIFNMELFVSILQTSYSFFTLISSDGDE